MIRQLRELSRHRGDILKLSIVAFLLLTGCGDPPDGEVPPGSIDDGGVTDDSADEVVLASDGRAKMPIVIGEEADAATELAAEELAEYLEKISSADFEVIRGQPEEGIAVGTVDQLDSPQMADVEFGDGPFDLEDYVIRSADDGLFLVGSTPLAVRFAVWDLLHRFGHRQFFPTDTWEVIPEYDELVVALDVREQPDYFNRQAPRGAMRMTDRYWAEEAWENWQIRNRTAPTFTLSTGHVYDSVIANNQKAFDDNPDYWGDVDGERSSDNQPNVAHPDVQQMFVDHAVEQLEADPTAHSVAMDPRDGNDWSTSPESLAIGGPTEQAVFLANLVAEEIVDRFGDDKFVGIYGYSHHSPPPEIDVHPNVIVSLATSYIRGGYTFEEMIDGWSERANMIGIREYYAIVQWDWSLPGDGADAADIDYLQWSIPHYHDRGARFMNAESNDTWGGYGLGYYLASRMLWDVTDAERVDELIDDFLEKSFGEAKEPMARFYELIDGSTSDPNVPQRRQPLNDDMVGRMYRSLNEARDLAEDDDVRERIDDLVLYTRYVDLFRRFDDAPTGERREEFDELISFTWRIRDTLMVDSLEIMRYIHGEFDSEEDFGWEGRDSSNEPADRHRTKEDEPFGNEEIAAFLQEGIDRHELLDFDIDHWDDSGELQPAGFAPGEPGGPEDRASRGDVEAVMATDDGTLPVLELSAGHVYDDRGPVRWTLKRKDGTVVDTGEVPPDEEARRFELSASTGGTYRFSIENTSQGFVWDLEPRGAKTTLLAGGEHRLERNWYDRLYFYVPEGTDEIYIAGSLLEDRHLFVDPDGEPVGPERVEVVQDFTVVPVSEGRDGGVWSLEMNAIRPDIRLLNIPGYVAFSPDELLLPDELSGELP